MICKRCLVSGKVQGVFYRASTARRARELDVAGYAMNLPDGRVEVLVYGEADNVRALCEWLWEGPAAARVTDVEIHDAEVGAIPAGFVTR
ncbi:MAG TPA: acylphosphatase [Gammaproteobacteria bacterium]|nr:acylphosphatase [Gammaproteobacteria bacterium]